jgi:hypothetical protein
MDQIYLHIHKITLGQSIQRHQQTIKEINTCQHHRPTCKDKILTALLKYHTVGKSILAKEEFQFQVSAVAKDKLKNMDQITKTFNKT